MAESFNLGFAVLIYNAYGLLDKGEALQSITWHWSQQLGHLGTVTVT